MWSLRGKITAQDPQAKFLAQRRFIFSIGTEGREYGTNSGDSRQGREGEGNGDTGCLSPGNKLPLGRKETDVAHRKMTL